MSNATELQTIIARSLNQIGLYSLAAEKLLMGTAAVESQFTFRRQFGGGPALGLFQMEPATFSWMTDHFLADKRHANLRKAVMALCGTVPPSTFELVHNDPFAAAMARIKYFSVHAPVPPTLQEQASYWSVYYNGVSPHGLRPKDYIKRWNEYCEPIYGASHHNSPPDTSLPQTGDLRPPIWV